MIDWPTDEQVSRQEVVDQNGNTGEHYRTLDELNKDMPIPAMSVSIDSVRRQADEQVNVSMNYLEEKVKEEGFD